MPEVCPPKYQWGQPVVTTADLLNDGSFPDATPDALLAPKGSRCEIVNIGAVEESGETVYLVELAGGRVIGVFESEISAL